MTTLQDTLVEARRTRNPNLLVDAIPYAGFLGFGLDLSRGELLGHLRYHDDLIGNPALPALHGGALGALLESTALFQVLWEDDVATLPKIVSLTIDYLRSGRPVDTYAKGTVTRRGRRVLHVHVEAWQEDRSRPVTSANVLFLVRPTDARGGTPPEAGRR